MPLKSHRAVDSTSSNTTEFWCNFPFPELGEAHGDYPAKSAIREAEISVLEVRNARAWRRQP